MRILAGVLLIVIAVLDVVSSAGYLLGGALASSAGKVGDEVVKADKDKNVDAQKAMEVTDKVKTQGTKASLIGLMLLVLTGLGIAAAVCLFRTKAAAFVMLTGILQIAAEAISCAFLNVAPGVYNYFGIAVGVIAIVAGLTYPKASAPAAPAAA